MKLGDVLSYGDDLAWRLEWVIVTPSFCAPVAAAHGARRGLAPWLSLEGKQHDVDRMYTHEAENC
jgi:hypothetical protein